MSNKVNEQQTEKGIFNLYEWARKHHILIYFALAVALVHTASFFYNIESETERWLMLPSAILIECFLAFLSYFSVKKTTPGGARAVSIVLGLIFLVVSGYLQRSYYLKAHNDEMTATIFGYLIPLAVGGMSLFSGSFDFAEETKQQKATEQTEAIHKLTEERDALEAEKTRIASEVEAMKQKAQSEQEVQVVKEREVAERITKLETNHTEAERYIGQLKEWGQVAYDALETFKREFYGVDEVRKAAEQRVQELEALLAVTPTPSQKRLVAPPAGREIEVTCTAEQRVKETETTTRLTETKRLVLTEQEQEAFEQKLADPAGVSWARLSEITGLPGSTARYKYSKWIATH